MNAKNKTKASGFRLPLSAVILYMALIAALLSGVTFSKYVAGTSAGDTARVAKFGNLEVSEEGSFAGENWVITPGVGLQKKAHVKFDSSESACYIFLSVKTQGWSKSADSDYDYALAGSYPLGWSVDSGVWKFLKTDSGANIYYMTVPANNAVDANIIANDGMIAVDESITRSEIDGLTANGGLSITLTATAVQYYGASDSVDDGLDEAKRAENAWASVRDK